MYTFKEATLSDIPIIRDLASQVWEPTYGAILSDEQLNYMFDMMYSEASLHEQMTKLNQLFFLFYNQEEPVGYLSLEKEQNNTYILQKIYALPDKQGKGLGRYMINTASTYIASLTNEAFTIKLFVNRHNKSVNFYSHLGFSIIDTRDHHIGNNYYMNDYIMAKFYQKNL